MMHTRKFAAWAVAATFCLAGALTSGSGLAADSKEAPVSSKLDNAGCLSCHDGKKGKIEVPVAGKDGEKRALSSVDQHKLSRGVHSDMPCVQCHKEITDNQSNHVKAKDVQPANCINCHTALWETVKKEKQEQEKERLGLVVQNIAAYKNSFHARPDKDDPSKPKATCEDCHSSHTFAVPPKGTVRRTAWHQSIPATCGAKCHEDQLDSYTNSIHGEEVLVKNNMKAAVCTDCHTSHNIVGASSDKAKLSITASCGDCHKNNFASYKASYHGQVNTLGYTYTAKCFDCHGSHDILPSKDPKAKLNPKNRLKTCQKCHNGKKDLPTATAGFLSFSPHGTTDDFEHYPEIWITYKFMIALLVGVFVFFWAHSLLWWYREYRDHKEGKHGWHIRAHDLPPDMLPFEERRKDLAHKHVRRFGAMWRLGHVIFAISVMTLVGTGMAAFYAQEDWAKAVMAAFGSPHVAGHVHRIAAFTMLSIFFIHLVVVTFNIARNWKTFKFFGADSLVPNLKDHADVVGMFKWFLGKGPRPAIERWAYWEKFDYWAVFWGMAIIGGSGMVLAYPHVVASVLPGWIFNIAMVVHGEEAFLAAVFLFTVHFFNNHFRPDKLPPPDVVMFTGTQSLEEFRHEHTAQYNRLVASGELENYLVEAPSASFTLASRILGLVLLAFGLSLLILVGVGFFGGHG